MGTEWGNRTAVSSRLRADCGRCVALCCVASGFTVSADFAIDKPAGVPCRNLRGDFGCSVHDHLLPVGFAGCVAYDCFGAGQHVVQQVYGGRDWRTEPEIADEMFAAFAVVRDLHELMWYLADAAARPETAALHDDIVRAYDSTGRLASRHVDELLDIDVVAHRHQVDAHLTAASVAVRAAHGPGPDMAHADLAGKRLRDLRGAHLRGTWLMGADLRAADLRGADVIGADLRGADVSGADLTDTLYLTQLQVSAARGDESTRIPATLDRPRHWRTRSTV
jgi:Pentapeptide repeats (8 copies)